MKNSENKKEKISLRERFKDKREKAKIELMFYGVFFVGVIIFARVLGSTSTNVQNNNDNTLNSFVYLIDDNYEYDIVLNMNDNVYYYYGKVLGNNSTINLKGDNMTKSYYLMNNKYYILENNNYILTDIDDVYPYIDYRYLNIKNIKEYLSVSTKENGTYIVQLKDILLNNQTEEYITIAVEEGDKNIVIDYTNLFKFTDESVNKLVVNITYNNINNIISLEE